MKVLQTALKTVFALLCLSPFIFFALIGFVLYKIKYGPVPPVPQLKIEYSIEDRMSATDYNVLRYYYDSNPLCAGRVLTNDGRIVQLGKADPGATMKNCEKTRKANRAFSSKLQTKNPTNSYSMYVSTFDSAGNAVAQQAGYKINRWLLMRKNGEKSTISTTPSGYPKWKNWCLINFHKLTKKEEIIGNVTVATGCASSGGASEPHGRKLPLLWRKGVTNDINSLIDPKIGWYLLEAIDINDKSQILCLAIKGNAIDAEKYNDTMLRFVVLTPLK